SHRQPRPQRQAGGGVDHPRVRPRRPGRPRLRAAGAAAAAQRGAGGTDHARAGEPDISRARPGDRASADPAGLHPGAGHPDPRRFDRGRADRDAGGNAAWPGSSSSRGCTRTPRPICSAMTSCAARACRSCWWTAFSPKVRAPFISPDDRAAMLLAVTHLVSLGHTRIGLALGPKRFVPVLRKIEGFQHAMRDRLGVAPEESEELIQHSLYTLEGGQAAAGALIDRGCTAVVCASDMMALGAIRAARRRELRVPQDVSVVGFDDSPLIAFTDPPLTTIRKPVQSMGQAAVRALLEEIGGTPAPPSEFVFLPELVVRGSTAAAHGARP
ncbi:LOW QUALITY PROTEIN: HTH-type transcriptional regulator MalR (Maltose operontranscriptional repressor), partial [Streptomyces himastatinicus ATCC 53653]